MKYFKHVEEIGYDLKDRPFLEMMFAMSCLQSELVPNQLRSEAVAYICLYPVPHTVMSD